MKSWDRTESAVKEIQYVFYKAMFVNSTMLKKKKKKKKKNSGTNIGSKGHWREHDSEMGTKLYISKENIDVSII